MDRKRIIFIDVDDTLIRTVGTTQIPMPASADYVRRMRAAGNTLYCWSRGGRDHARNVTESLGIADCFVEFLPKPDICLDDRGDKLLDYCEFILPSNAVNHLKNLTLTECRKSCVGILRCNWVTCLAW